MLAPSAPSRFHRALERRAPANGRPTAAGRPGWDGKARLGSAPACGGPGRHASDTVTDCSLGQRLPRAPTCTPCREDVRKRGHPSAQSLQLPETPQSHLHARLPPLRPGESGGSWHGDCGSPQVCAEDRWAWEGLPRPGQRGDGAVTGARLEAPRFAGPSPLDRNTGLPHTLQGGVLGPVPSQASSTQGAESVTHSENMNHS